MSASLRVRYCTVMLHQPRGQMAQGQASDIAIKAGGGRDGAERAGGGGGLAGRDAHGSVWREGNGVDEVVETAAVALTIAPNNSQVLRCEGVRGWCAGLGGGLVAGWRGDAARSSGPRVTGACTCACTTGFIGLYVSRTPLTEPRGGRSRAGRLRVRESHRMPSYWPWRTNPRSPLPVLRSSTLKVRLQRRFAPLRGPSPLHAPRQFLLPPQLVRDLGRCQAESDNG